MDKRTPGSVGALQAPKGGQPWEEKAQRALEARRAATARRKGKPKSFRAAVGNAGR